LEWISTTLQVYNLTREIAFEYFMFGLVANQESIRQVLMLRLVAGIPLVGSSLKRQKELIAASNPIKPQLKVSSG
jgi:hypothetical protein